MKKTFSREYWFLVSCWAVFTLLGLAAGALGGLSPDSGALWRFKDPVMAYTGVQTAAAVLLSAANALSGAAAGMIAIRYWVKPYLLLWLLMLVWNAGTVWPALIRSGGIGYAGLALLSLLLSGAVTFCLAKGLYRLLKGREWAVALTLVLLGAALQLTSLLTAIGRTPAYVDVPIAPRVGALIKDTLLSVAAYALLFLCIQQWWERGARAATGELEEKKEEAEEELFEEEQKEERENP